MLASLCATVFFIIPVAACFLLTCRRDTPLWLWALLIPSAVAFDLLLVLVLAMVMRLDFATWVARALWLAVTAGLIAARPNLRAKIRWPKAITPHVGAACAIAVVVATFISTQVSRVYSIWDRRWHIPLVTSLRGQTVPFHNVFDPAQGLHYHFSGDAQAAMLQALSFSRLHSSFTLSLAHDIYFALTGLTLSLLMSWWGYRRFGAFALAQLAVLLSGPLTLLRDGIRNPQHGYSLINYLSLSFRPHIALCGLLMLGFVTAVLVRIRKAADAYPSMTVAALVACSAALAITDETSLGLLGLSLGAVWLVWPDVVHPARKQGAIVFAALLAALVVPNLAFGASFAPGGQRHTVALAAWRSPGCYTPVIPLSDPHGRLMLLFDLAPTVLAITGALLVLLTLGASSSRRPIAAFSLVLTALSLLALTRVDVDHSALESHRFMTAAMFLAPVLALYAFADTAVLRRGSSVYAYGLGLAAVGALGGALSTLDWLYSICPRWANKHDHYFANIDHYAVDCRAAVNARVGQSVEQPYIDKPSWYLFAGCVPVYAPGEASGSRWELTIGQPVFGTTAARVLSSWSGGNKPLSMVCGVGTQADPLCTRAVQAHACQPAGNDVQRCTLSQPLDARRAQR